jgi:KUP system potassium uptake protein
VTVPDAGPVGDEVARVAPTRRGRVKQKAGFALTLGALGVVFGDIGTSPLYALQSRSPSTTAR